MILFGGLAGVIPSLAGGLAGGLYLARASSYYLAFLAAHQRRSGRWLPWRLTCFLDWCHRAGLVRVAGSGYQFRHRELQEYLVKHPTSAG